MSTLRRSLSLGLIAGLLAVIVIGLLPDGDPPTAEERVHEIASNIKCPSCNNASIADANSSVARDLLVVIREQVEAGLSDDDIYDYFVARFSDAALLSPPTRGWGLWLWMLPIGGLVVGAAVILRRKRGHGSAAGDVADRLEAAERDLSELDAQLATGEIDPIRGAMLRSGYESEVAAARALLEAEDAGPVGRNGRRAVAGTTLIAVSMLVIGLSVGASLRDREPGDVITGDVVRAAAEEGAVDLASVTNEQMEEVVAQFPDNVPMRRALANRYFFAGDLDKAFDHYFEVLRVQERLGATPDPVALANVGWITYLSSAEVDTALSLVERSLDVEPENPIAMWYLANIRFGGLNDPAGALEPLNELLRYPDLPEDLRGEAQRMLDAAEEAL